MRKEEIEIIADEEWRDIEGYEGRYQVSDCGRVRSLIFSHLGYYTILSQAPNFSGYMHVVLSKANKKKTFLVHRLVA